MFSRFQQFCESRLAVALILVVFAVSIAVSWHGSHSVAVADEISYVTGGVSLVTTGCFTNPFGESELWFPPVYPVLIGLSSLGGWLDPFVVARVLSVIAAVATLLLFHGTIVLILSRAAESLDSFQAPHQLRPRLVACVATALLATNPTFQTYASRALSESLALCLSLLGLHLWLRQPTTFRSAGWSGLVIGLATLTRPECVLVLPLWCAIDVLRQRDLRTMRRGLVASAVCVATLLPYAAYLHEHTGRWTISNKSHVNLAAGRAAFFGTPREYIDEATLRLDYFPVDTSLPSELKRFGRNCHKLVTAFTETYFRWWLASAALFLMVSGAFSLWRRGDRRLVLCLLASFPYLAIVVAYDVSGPKNLHLALPAFSLFAAAAIAGSLRSQRRVVVLSLCGLVGLLMLEGTTRFPRWTRSESFAAGSGLRDAGLRLRDANLPPGVMYEFGATTAYYSGLERRYLTPNCLETVLAYIDLHEPANRAVYLTVSSNTQHAVHSTTSRLLDEPRPHLELVLELNSPEHVVVYRVDRPLRSE